MQVIKLRHQKTGKLQVWKLYKVTKIQNVKLRLVPPLPLPLTAPPTLLWNPLLEENTLG